MSPLTARDALSEHVVCVTAEARPPIGQITVHRETVYAVFDEVAQGGECRFRGLVAGRHAAIFPQRIFADLLPSRPAACLAPDTPLEQVERRLRDESVCGLPVADQTGTYLGAVTRESVLQLLLRQERRASQGLRRCLELQEQQRSLMAFEIHDGLIQNITAARMHLQAATASPGMAPQAAAGDLAESLALLQTAISEARSLLRGLHPARLEELGLRGALESLLSDYGGTSERHIELVVAEPAPEMPLEAQTAVFRIVQEALTNAVRHSHAHRIRAELSFPPGLVRIYVRDWGRGFDPAAVRSGYGLEGIRYRARAMYGEAAIDSAPGKGTQVTVSFPIAGMKDEG